MLTTFQFEQIQHQMTLEVIARYNEWAAFWATYPLVAERYSFDFRNLGVGDVEVMVSLHQYEWKLRTATETVTLPGWYLDIQSASDRKKVLEGIKSYYARLQTGR